uniref:RRM domain-containing protein n=1 Tax=Chromera velia CCMP2878 TaxID=1169474 RepID=A0A0G4GX89_9ALVE|eukprot:Cvel_23766.t1-p1 / transcript=Cvel_23766.t1 / gene=Cvel_23766 / organism=Chromera_velia_CCMP2878 / gene_product=Polyadenylate-binding protein, cytoplasmic and, putative / transcript_product=Polyadenylate-binding protein, cytoplasmic and, putative / location=Cvel_scaffold2491:14965-20115(+) / protein_length=1010 / sequence_SO=supercontig / SO=protein_coding / is_pseudo=false
MYQDDNEIHSDQFSPPPPSSHSPEQQQGRVRPLTALQARQEELVGCEPGVGPLGANLFVFRLPGWVEERDLRYAFSPFGTVTSCKVARDRRGVSKAFGFICYSNSWEALAALQQMDNQILHPSPARRKLQYAKLQHQQLQQQQHGSGPGKERDKGRKRGDRSKGNVAGDPAEKGKDATDKEQEKDMMDEKGGTAEVEGERGVGGDATEREIGEEKDKEKEGARASASSSSTHIAVVEPGSSSASLSAAFSFPIAGTHSASFERSKAEAASPFRAASPTGTTPGWVAASSFPSPSAQRATAQESDQSIGDGASSSFASDETETGKEILQEGEEGAAVKEKGRDEAGREQKQGQQQQMEFPSIAADQAAGLRRRIRLRMKTGQDVQMRQVLGIGPRDPLPILPAVPVPWGAVAGPEGGEGVSGERGANGKSAAPDALEQIQAIAARGLGLHPLSLRSDEGPRDTREHSGGSSLPRGSARPLGPPPDRAPIGFSSHSSAAVGGPTAESRHRVGGGVSPPSGHYDGFAPPTLGGAGAVRPQYNPQQLATSYGTTRSSPTVARGQPRGFGSNRHSPTEQRGDFPDFPPDDPQSRLPSHPSYPELRDGEAFAQMFSGGPPKESPHRAPPCAPPMRSPYTTTTPTGSRDYKNEGSRSSYQQQHVSAASVSRPSGAPPSLFFPHAHSPSEAVPQADVPFSFSSSPTFPTQSQQPEAEGIAVDAPAGFPRRPQYTPPIFLPSPETRPRDSIRGEGETAVPGQRGHVHEGMTRTITPLTTVQQQRDFIASQQQQQQQWAGAPPRGVAHFPSHSSAAAGGGGIRYSGTSYESEALPPPYEDPLPPVHVEPRQQQPDPQAQLGPPFFQPVQQQQQQQHETMQSYHHLHSSLEAGNPPLDSTWSAPHPSLPSGMERGMGMGGHGQMHHQQQQYFRGGGEGELVGRPPHSPPRRLPPSMAPPAVGVGPRTMPPHESTLRHPGPVGGEQRSLSGQRTVTGVEYEYDFAEWGGGNGLLTDRERNNQ